MPYPRRKPILLKAERQALEKEPRVPRTRAARLLGVSAQTLKKYPIPFRQYGAFAPAMYRLSDVLAFRAGHEVNPE